MKSDLFVEEFILQTGCGSVLREMCISNAKLRCAILGIQSSEMRAPEI
jgi:hypothetical protein